MAFFVIFRDACQVKNYLLAFDNLHSHIFADQNSAFKSNYERL